VLLDSDENDSVSCCVVFNCFIVFHSYGRYIRNVWALMFTCTFTIEKELFLI